MENLYYLNLFTTDPAFNLAAEQYVFDVLPKDRAYFMLWQNDNAIIIGKYQNTAAEINSSYVEKNGIKVVRRLSGGGAVYHDMGNLNFTFIADAGDMDRLNMHIFCEPIVAALEKMGVKAEINGRNDMTIDGKKFSGNSQYLSKGRIMHHGTIMYDSNLETVGSALNVDKTKIESKGIKSVRSRVTNIIDYIPEKTSIQTFRETLLKCILDNTPGTEYIFTDEDIERIKKIQTERYDTWDWNYGRSLECSMVNSERFEGCGKVECRINTDHGIINCIEFTGDYFSKKDPYELSDLLSGHRLNREEISSILDGVNVDEYIHGLDAGRLTDLILK